MLLEISIQLYWQYFQESRDTEVQAFDSALVPRRVNPATSTWPTKPRDGERRPRDTGNSSYKGQCYIHIYLHWFPNVYLFLQSVGRCRESLCVIQAAISYLKWSTSYLLSEGGWPPEFGQPIKMYAILSPEKSREMAPFAKKKKNPVVIPIKE